MSLNSILNSKHTALFSRSNGDNWNDIHASCRYSYDLHLEEVAVPSHDGMHNTLPQSINNLIILDSERAKR